MMRTCERDAPRQPSCARANMGGRRRARERERERFERRGPSAHRLLHNLRARRRERFRRVEQAAAAVEAEDLLRDARGGARLDLVHVAQHRHPRRAVAVVERARRQHAEQRRLAALRRADARDAHLGLRRVGERLHEDLGDLERLAVGRRRAPPVQHAHRRVERRAHARERRERRAHLVGVEALEVAVVLDADLVDRLPAALGEPVLELRDQLLEARRRRRYQFELVLHVAHLDLAREPLLERRLSSSTYVFVGREDH